MEHTKFIIAQQAKSVHPYKNTQYLGDNCKGSENMWVNNSM